MLGIVDNDVLAKLARYEFLPGFNTYLKKLKLTPVLQPSISATFDLDNKSGKLGKVLHQHQKDALITFAKDRSRIILDGCGQELVRQCHLSEGIDPGDAVWLAAAACSSGAHVFTGDKFALRGASKAPECAEIVERIAGRCHCFEQIILEMIEIEGIAIVRKNVLTDSTCDDSVYNAINGATSKSDAIEGLNQAIGRLRASTGNLLHP